MGWRGSLLVLVLLLGCSAEVEPIEQPILMPGESPFVYPTALWDQRIKGETLLLLRITQEGAVDSISVFVSSGHMQFDSAAVTGARKLRFVPGKQGDKPVRMWTKLPVRFSLDSAGVGR